MDIIESDDTIYSWPTTKNDEDDDKALYYLNAQCIAKKTKGELVKCFKEKQDAIKCPYFRFFIMDGCPICKSKYEVLICTNFRRNYKGDRVILGCEDNS